MAVSVPHIIETERLIIRCYKPDDASMLLKAITDSIENLKRWMPWAKDEPTDLNSKTKLLEKFISDFEANIDFTYGIFNKAETELIGSIGLHNRVGKNAKEIGYWISSNHLNQGYATEAVFALINKGFNSANLERIEIHCDPNNYISQLIPKKLGFNLARTVKNNMTDPSGASRDTMIWSLENPEYTKSQ